jgi:L-alanine-DL-glutamate epimerase-like enolase superfamily enzyme
MERRDLLSLSTAALGALMAGPLLNSCQNKTSRSTNGKPNIVFIINVLDYNIEIIDGCVKVPDGPGFGVGLNGEVFKKVRLDI